MKAIKRYFLPVVGLLLYGPFANAQFGFFENFDDSTNPFAFTNTAGAPPSIQSEGGVHDRFARLANLNGGNNNSIAFDEVPTQTGPAPDGLRLEFDFRMTGDGANDGAGGCCGSAADGLGIGIYSTATYGTSGGSNPAAGGAVWERPAHPDAFTVGLDIFQNIDVVNINWAGIEVAAADVSDFFDLNNDVWHRAIVDILPDGGGALVDLNLIEDVDGLSEVHNVFSGEPVSGLDLASLPDYRIIAGGRTGGAFHNGDFDNIALTSARICWLEAGDADQDWDFDMFDIIQVMRGMRYLMGPPATWEQGDWNGAPGHGPPPGNNQFDMLDLVAASIPGHYLMGKYCEDSAHAGDGGAALVGGGGGLLDGRLVDGGLLDVGGGLLGGGGILGDGLALAALSDHNGSAGDGQTSIVYDARTGELAIYAPLGVALTSINIDSAVGIFTADAAQNLGGSFDNDADSNIFKATFGGSFGSISFGNVAGTGLAKDFVLNDLTVVGSLAGGGALDNVDLIYNPIPEPASIVILGLGLVGVMLVGLPRTTSYPRSTGRELRAFHL